MQRTTLGGHIIIQARSVDGTTSKTMLIRLTNHVALARFRLPVMRHIFFQIAEESVVISLLHTPLSAAFDSFVDSFLSGVQDSDASDMLLDRLFEAFDNFKRLVQLEPCLTANQCKGLYGEWLYIRFQLQNGADQMEVIESWFGPDSTAHDFVLSSHCCEVKSVARQSTQLLFSSENQLQALPDRPLQLMVNRIESINNAGEDSMAALYSELLRLLTDDAAAQLFTEKCENVSTGYYGPESVTYPYRFHVIDTTFYTVDQTKFPGLRTGNLPPGVSHVSFRLDQSLLTEFVAAPL